ncbi:RNA-binding cell elongation regulator Jag/EloR [Breznakiella homolactica]|uniref:RNA-binding protein KhpB n=1 Tax=Breznakiella homolactica TaxID=2798577 RepID=A0A7T7XPS7_9SPIR|nr:RNA-binding cell elongation regulator Jag/EloR [Breznakiella homolactica]QQO10289.1 protein jag [Breznakiella homolactica]
MIYEFEGRTEKEAIDRAAEELGLEKDGFDVEILETQKSGLFKKGFVKIQVHTDKPVSPPPRPQMDGNSGDTDSQDRPSRQAVFGDPEPKNDFEQQMIDFATGLIEHMGYPGSVSIQFREEHKIGLKIDSEYSSILIGKKGKNLDALQLLANIYASKIGREDMRVILDSENYRIRREESLVRLAYTVADRVRENRGSILLEPMNPFDRRLIHTTLNDISDVETKSEGEGLYKQVRVFYRGSMR